MGYQCHWTHNKIPYVQKGSKKVYCEVMNNVPYIGQGDVYIVTNSSEILGGTSYHGVQQGFLGDCWFCSLVASLTEAKQSQIFTKIYPSRINPAGVYLVEVFIFLRRYYVLIDDFIPVDANDNPVFGRSRQKNEIWFMLLEKAFAKISGCYQYMIGSYPKS